MIEAPRLILRSWREADLPAFAALNADTRVMQYLPGLLSREQSDHLARVIQQTISERGFGLWAAELRERSQFIGFIGLWIPRFEAHFTPCVEIGWRLAREHWGHGYGTEGAAAALRYGFERLNLAEIVSFTTISNQRSWRVMQRIGMSHSPADDFDHPAFPVGHPLRPHLLYRVTRERWKISSLGTASH